MKCKVCGNKLEDHSLKQMGKCAGNPNAILAAADHDLIVFEGRRWRRQLGKVKFQPTPELQKAIFTLILAEPEPKKPKAKPKPKKEVKDEMEDLWQTT